MCEPHSEYSPIWVTLSFYNAVLRCLTGDGWLTTPALLRSHTNRWNSYPRDGAFVRLREWCEFRRRGMPPPFAPPTVPNLIVLCAGYDPLAHVTPRVRAFLSRANRADTMIGGVDTGTVILAELGLLDGYQAVLHFEAEGEFRESWPDIALSDQIYCLDRQRLTAAGGTATGDAVLAWLQQEFGGDFAAATTEAMSHGAMRKGEESQKLLSSIDPVLRRMRSLMRDHLAQPFKLGQICQVLNVSEKQLRTRCQRTFGLTPQAYYLVVRLEQAQYLLRNTHMPITEVALATGFGSLTGFSRAFRHRYGASPRTYRKATCRPGL